MADIQFRRRATSLDPIQPDHVATKQFVDQYARAAGVGTLRALRPALSWGQDSAVTAQRHAAFPSIVQRRDGILYMVLRRGTNHAATRDGGIWYTTSADGGRTWATPVQLWAASGGVEYRDPCVSLSADGTKLYLSYFKGSAALGAGGCFFRSSTDGGITWSAEVRVDPLPYSACCAPVVELSTGRLVLPLYGKDALADTWESVYVAVSTNGGASWTTVKIYNGAAVSLHLQEPWISRKPGADDLIMTYRFGNNDRIGQGTTSQTDGFGWSAAVPQFAGTGRPSTVWLSTGEVVITYRDSTNQLMYTRMYTGGAWTWPTLVRRTPSGGFWTYAHPIEVAPGVALCPFAEESSGATPSRIFLTAITRGGGWSPLGQIPPDHVATATRYDYIAYATNFRERTGTALGPEWTVLSGALVIAAEGYLSSAVADAAPDRAIVDVNAANATIEADFYMTVQSGAAVLFRVVDASNFLMWTVETGGTNLRLYKVVAGAATQLTTAATVPVAFNSWNTFRVEATDTQIRAYLNGVFVATYTLAAGAEASTFTTPGRHGVGLNAQSGGIHYCRRFAVTSR